MSSRKVHPAEMLTDEQLKAVSIEQLMSWANELLSESQSIESELSNLNRVDENGRRMLQSEWNEWRQKAKFAMIKKRELYRKIENTRKVKQHEERMQLQHEGLSKFMPVARDLLRELSRLDLSGSEYDRLRECATAITRMVFTHPEELNKVLTALGG